LKVLVGSANPVKIGATRDVFEEYFRDVEVVGIEVASGVPAQPVGDDTFAGAENRARGLVSLNRARGLAADYCAGLEGGIAQLYGRWFAFGVLCVADAAGRLGFGVSPLFELPPGITGDLLAGEELGHVVDRLSGQHNTKQKGGAIAFLTQERVGRRQLYSQGLAMALVPFLNEELYFAASVRPADDQSSFGS
jgi:inosine/xanthosine triphosphatase